MDFRKPIKTICNQKGITQKELSEKLGISDISLNKTLRGGYPQLQTLEKIASVLNVPVSALFEPCEMQPNEFSICPHCGGKIRIAKV